MLNCFAYTCGFSVCAAAAGAVTTSLDLSQKYLAWGRANMARCAPIAHPPAHVCTALRWLGQTLFVPQEANGLDPAAHDWIYGDCFDWLKRLGKKARGRPCA